MADYFYIDTTTNQQCGPFSIAELGTKNIKADTMVWCSGMSNWLAAGTVPELSSLFQSSPVADTTQSTTPPAPVSQQQGGMYDNNVYGERTRRNPNDLNNIREIPKTWLVESILVTVFCCLPFGIAAILNASKVESLFYAGDYEASEKASKDAKKWTMVSLISTGAIYVIIFLFYFVAIIGALGMNNF